MPTSIEEIGVSNLPVKFALKQNFPNPFNPSTTINYELEIVNSEFAKLKIFNVLGAEVKEFTLTQPNGSVVWNGTDKLGKAVSSGVYFYTLESSTGLKQTKKMLLLK
ncbi:MAG: T9SS C-terminal target domain-containing protein [Calditrichaeota bacterium]|nr:MAG: T9SS C-terminal target domain-containing protein [Calditrichota bacterium]